MEPDINWIKSLTYEAGLIIKENFYVREKKTEYKISSADLVTKTDLEVEHFLIDKIRERFSHHQFLCEETCKKNQMIGDEPTWVIDPVDGTMNFVHTIPFVAISIAFCVNKELQLGIIYNPIMEELFYAVKGQGAFLEKNGQTRSLRVAPQRDLHHSVVSTGFSVAKIRKIIEPDERQKLTEEQIKEIEEIRDLTFDNTQNLITHCRDVRRLGSCASEMAFVDDVVVVSVAAGRFDAMMELGVKEWDLAAGVLIIEEAGGAVINFDKKHPAELGVRHIIGASSMKLANHLADILRCPTFDQRVNEGV